MASARHAVDRVAAAQPSVAELDDYELGEDVWDVRLFPAARYDPHRSNYALNFVPIPAPFRTIVKRYVKLRLATWSYASCRQHLQFLPRFLTFFVTRYPGVQQFRDLTVDDIEVYLHHLQSTGTTTGKPLSSSYRSLAISTLELFLRYLQRIDSSLAPTRPLDKLIWPEHRPLYQRRPAQGIRYIPETVLAQLDAHIHKLRARYIPVIILLWASGWRISDVLQLRYDSCLEHTERGWYLVGDIHKTQVLGHKVPITDEVAAVIQAQVNVAKQRLADRFDFHRYLFPAYSQRRQQQPLEVGTIMRALNRLAVTCEIRDQRGELFHFRSHAFRHTKAVELINNGMPLTYVQQWLAHASPEMTLVYAKLLDTTMRDKWEQAMAQGAVRITSTGQPYAVDPATLERGDELELAHVRAHLDARRLQNGYCFKPQKFDCPAAHIPCYSCAMFVTTPAFLPQFEHEQRETIELIQIGEARGAHTGWRPTTASWRNWSGLWPAWMRAVSTSRWGKRNASSSPVRPEPHRQRGKRTTMQTKTWQRNTSGLVAHAKRRTEVTRARVQTAIEALLRAGTPITFQAVAAAARVSKAYLYQQPAIRERIEHLRTQTVAPLRSTQSARSDKSAGVLLVAKEQRIKQLEAENRQLRAELQGALAQLYERL